MEQILNDTKMNDKILIIDNYDSFTYNLVHLVNEIGPQCEVWRNDKFNIGDVDAFDRIILSPGPGIPSEAGLLLEVIRKNIQRFKKRYWRLPWSAGYRRSIWRQTLQS